MPKKLEELEHELALTSLRSHELHMRHIYGLRWGGLVVAAITIIIGAIMTFLGLEGSFNWAVEIPQSVGAKLTNASPGIVFATIGLILAFVVIIRKPVNYSTSRDRKAGRSAQSINFGVDYVSRDDNG